jgi:hypothetical protein
MRFSSRRRRWLITFNFTIGYSTSSGGHDVPSSSQGTGNFALSQTSPCINVGADVSAFVWRDLLGVPRPPGAAVDIGAFEFAVTSELRLSGLRAPGRLILTWDGGPGIRLQRTTSLTPATWTDVNGSEGLSTLEVPLGGLSEFFRLVKPQPPDAAPCCRVQARTTVRPGRHPKGNKLSQLRQVFAPSGHPPPQACNCDGLTGGPPRRPSVPPQCWAPRATGGSCCRCSTKPARCRRVQRPPA